MPFISVIIAARNEEQNIGNCLQDLSQQTYPADRFEIIVVDDHSTDATPKLLQDYSKEIPNLRILKATPLNGKLTPKKNAINCGIQQSVGDIIFTTDADCRIKPTWIESILGYFTEEVGMVVGFSQFIGRDGKFSFIEKLQALDFISLMASAEGSSNLGFPLAASGQNLAYRRKAFDEVGGFEFIGHRVSGDDVLLLQLIRRLTKWKIRFADSSKSFNATYAKTSISEILNQRRRWASNAPFQIKLNKLFYLLLVNVFLVNIGLLFGIPLAVFGSISWRLILLGLCGKVVVELIIAIKACFKFHRIELLKIFPAWFILQIPYVFLAGIMGSFGSFTWKDRKHEIREIALEPVSKR
ncbi:glycosyltransferase [candidate division KSB1 bacterium]|nr:glycosyltransferase [candidate division KSB1 bacterium]